MKSPVLSIISFTFDNKELLRHAFAIREEVFVKGQDCPPEEEFDEFDPLSVHYLALWGENPAGTARYRETDGGIKLERFAVPEEYRNKGIGLSLVRKLVEDTRNTEKCIYIHAQAYATGFYEREGFEKTGGVFDEVGIDHYKMIYKP